MRNWLRHSIFFLPLKPSKQGAKKDWIDREVKKFSAEKRQLWKRYLKTKSQSDKEAYEKQSKLSRKKIRGKVLKFYEKQMMTEAGNRNRKFFQFVNEVVKINGDEKTVEKNAVDDLDKFKSFFATIGANLAKKFYSPKLTHRAKQINSMFFRTIDEK